MAYIEPGPDGSDLRNLLSKCEHVQKVWWGGFDIRYGMPSSSLPSAEFNLMMSRTGFFSEARRLRPIHRRVTVRHDDLRLSDVLFTT